jgi:hypothetical protein
MFSTYMITQRPAEPEGSASGASFFSKRKDMTMATLPTDDDKLRIVLDIFKHFGTRPGEALRPNNIVAAAANMGLRMNDVTRGLEVGGERGYFENGQNKSIKLTDTGFAAV